MCRLFGMSGGDHRVSGDVLAARGARQPRAAEPPRARRDRARLVRRRRAPARSPSSRSRPTRTRSSRARRASSSRPCSSPTSATRPPARLDVANTHPFEQRGRLFAHNGVILELERLERELGDDLALVTGDTDSERLFALVTREIERHGGDVGAGIAAAARWVAAELPLYAINVILGTPDGLWALRYPDTHELWVLERGAGGPGGDRHLDAASAAGTVRVRSEPLSRQPVGDRRQRADGRGPGLAAARPRRADPRRAGAAASSRRSSSTARRRTC